MSAKLPPRFIQQPGAVHAERIVAVPAQARSLMLTLPAGVPLLEGVRRGFAEHGFTSGVVELTNVKLGPFAYVIPGLSKTPANAAFYSDTFRPAGITLCTTGAMTFGTRDEVPFFHCHGLWVEADGKQSGGHMLPEETVVAETVEVTALGLTGAALKAEADAEINFKVFGPVAVAGQRDERAAGRAVAIRLRPNQDFHAALVAACRQFDIKRGRIRGGVGSTIGAVFDDGRVVQNFATEVYIEHGTIDGDAVTVDIGLIDYTGATARGRLASGQNPVLMTFELAIEVVDDVS